MYFANQVVKIILLFLLVLLSCDDKEFKKELEFVKQIAENPEKIQETIESSSFYDINEFYMCGFSYEAFKNYFKSIDKENVEITTTIGNAHHKGKRINGCKIIDIHGTNEQLSPSFTFKEINGKIIILNLCFVAN